MTHDVQLRDVHESDLPIFFQNQLDPEATRMAAFPPRAHDAFMAHWTKILADVTNIARTILFHGKVAGNMCCWQHAGKRNIGYWLGKQYWGQGIASAALAQFLKETKERPLYAHVAKHNAGSLRVLQKCGFTIAGEDRFPGVAGDEGEEFVLMLGAKDPGRIADATDEGAAHAV